MSVIRGFVSLLGRLLLAAIFLGSAAMHHIPDFNAVVREMVAEGVPAPTVMHVGAIAFMLLGGISLVLGYKARIGATMLLVFLALAAYWFHDFWTLQGTEAMEQQIHFMKNLAMMGGMLIVIANGPGAWSLDNRRQPVVAERALASA